MNGSLGTINVLPGVEEQGGEAERLDPFTWTMLGILGGALFPLWATREKLPKLCR